MAVIDLKNLNVTYRVLMNKSGSLKELFRDVRKGMNIKESVDLNEEFEVLLEGVHDQGIFKAIFLAGGPGSGKDYVLDNTLAGHGMVEINSDKALEFLMDKKNLSKTMPASEKIERFSFFESNFKAFQDLKFHPLEKLLKTRYQITQIMGS